MSGETYTPPAPFAPRGLQKLKALLVSCKPSAYLETYTNWTRENFDAQRWQWVATKAFFLKLQTCDDEITEAELKHFALRAIGEDVGTHTLRASEELRVCARVLGATCAVAKAEGSMQFLTTTGQASFQIVATTGLHFEALAYYDEYVRIEQERFGANPIQFPAACPAADVLDLSELCIDSPDAYKIARNSMSDSTKRYFELGEEGYESALSDGLHKMLNCRTKGAEAALHAAASNFGFAVELRDELYHTVTGLSKLEISAVEFYTHEQRKLAGTKRHAFARASAADE